MNDSDQAAGPLVWLVTIVVTALLLVASAKALWLVVPLLLAIILYYMLFPFVRRLELAGIGRETAAALAAGAFALLAIAVLVPTVPWLVGQSVSGEEALNRYLAGGRVLIDRTLTTLESQFAFLARMNFHAEAGRKLQEFGDTFMQKQVAEMLLRVAAGLPSLLLSPFVAFFLLRDGRKMLQMLYNAVPNAYFERSVYMFDRVHNTARNYFSGLLKQTAVDTVLLGVGLLLVGVPNAFVLGLAAAVLEWIPVVGAALACAMVVLIAATAFPTDPWVVYAALGVFVAVRMLDSFVVMPLTVGRSVRMHPVVAVLMIFIGGSVAGIPGLVLGLPLAGVVAAIVGTIGGIVVDPRLHARHAYAKALEGQRMNADLRL
jgi:predicted PurR-regulated permease PerM